MHYLRIVAMAKKYATSFGYRNTAPINHHNQHMSTITAQDGAVVFLRVGKRGSKPVAEA
jgi:hypothetical protein